LAREVGVTSAHLSRVLRRVDYKTPSPDLASKAATAFGLPPDDFPQCREGSVIEKIRRDPNLRDRLYDELEN
jgi:hypothetical protein